MQMPPVADGACCIPCAATLDSFELNLSEHVFQNLDLVNYDPGASLICQIQTLSSLQINLTEQLTSHGSLKLIVDQTFLVPIERVVQVVKQGADNLIRL